MERRGGERLQTGRTQHAACLARWLSSSSLNLTIKYMSSSHGVQPFLNLPQALRCKSGVQVRGSAHERAVGRPARSPHGPQPSTLNPQPSASFSLSPFQALSLYLSLFELACSLSISSSISLSLRARSRSFSSSSLSLQACGCGRPRRGSTPCGTSTSASTLSSSWRLALFRSHTTQVLLFFFITLKSRVE